MRWIDPASLAHLAAPITEMAAIAHDFGATLTVTPAAEVLGGRVETAAPHPGRRRLRFSGRREYAVSVLADQKRPR